jgi:hypothetical protein
VETCKELVSCPSELSCRAYVLYRMFLSISAGESRPKMYEVNDRSTQSQYAGALSICEFANP